MVDVADALAPLVRDAALQTSVVFAVGLLIARLVAKRPARAHAVLALTFAAALVAPWAAGVVRLKGWGLLAPQAPSVAAKVPPIAPVSRIARTAGAQSKPAAAIEPAQFDQKLPREISDDAALATLDTLHVEERATVAGGPAVSSPPRSATSNLRALAVLTFVAAWFVATLLLLGRLARGLLAGLRLVARSEACGAPAVVAALASAQRQLRLEQWQVGVVQSPNVRCPMIWCWGPPRLLLPADAARRWSAAQWTPILCHELAHLKRRDHWATLAAELACALLPWQLLAWRSKRRMEHQSEQACDDWAVAAGHSATEYAETLLGLVAQGDQPLALAALRRSSGLAGRVRHVLSQTVPRPRLGRLFVAVLLGTATCGVVAAALCQRGVVRAEEAPTGPQEASPAAPSAEPAKPAIGKVQRWRATGRVVNSDDQPIAGADVYWDITKRLMYTRGDWPGPKSLAKDMTDADGRFTLEADFSKDDAHETIVVRATGYGLRAANGLVDFDKPDKPVEIRMEPSYPIEGTVYSPNGEPVAEARVRVTHLSRWSDPAIKLEKPNSWYLGLTKGETFADRPREYWPAAVTTDAAGKFRIEDVVQRFALAELVIDASDFALTLVGVAGADSPHIPEHEDHYREPNFTIVLEKPYVVHGRFVDEKTGAPVANVRVEVEPGAYGRARLTRQVASSTSDSDGRYTLRLGSADYYSARVFPPPGYPAASNSFNSREFAELAGADRQFDYEVKLRPGLILKGRVVDAQTGTGVADAQVHYMAPQGRTLGVNRRFEPVTTAADGTFEITGVDGKGFLLVDALGQGFYRLAIKDSRIPYYREGIYPHGLAEIDVPQEGQAEPVVIAVHRGPELAIRPLGPDGKPVKQIRGACAESDFDGFFSAQASPDGIYRLEAAEPRRKYRVYLFSEDAMAGAVAEVEARADGMPIDVTLQPCATIRGRYVYEGGAPAPEVSNFTRFRMNPDEKPEGNAKLNLPFYDNFSGRRNDQRVTDSEGNFELDGIVPGAFIYLGLNFTFTDGGDRSYEIGILKPGEVRDVGELVIQPR